MINFLDYANHVFFFPSLLASGFLLVTLATLGEKQNLKKVLSFLGCRFFADPVHDLCGLDLSWAFVPAFVCNGQSSLDV